MLRATNTGMTALIDAGGRVSAVLKPFSAGVLTVETRGHAGATPYVRWGNWPAISVAALLLGAAWVARRRARGHAPA
jgi:apolipoprotein N-acyltransferase